MPSNPLAHWQAFVDQIRQQDLVEFARSQGFQVRSSAPKTGQCLCPFHDDRTPSLSFFVGKDGASLFRCFPCDKSGDAIRFVTDWKKVDFKQACQELGKHFGIALPRSKASLKRSFRNDAAYKFAEQSYRKHSKDEGSKLKAWIKSRGFAQNDIKSSEVAYATSGKLLASTESDRFGRELLKSVGLLREPRRTQKRERQDNLFEDESPLLEFYRDDRIVFPLRDPNGVMLGFAGRAVSVDAKPKFLFSPGLEKSKFLFGFDRVVDEARRLDIQSEGDSSIDLYVVEGILDVFRLRKLGFVAVGVLGSKFLDSQIQALDLLLPILNQKNIGLNVHLFLDNDISGQKGTSRSLPRLLSHASRFGYFVDVISPVINGDPDELLLGITKKKSKSSLTKWAVSAARYLFANHAKVLPNQFDSRWGEMSITHQRLVLKKVYQQLTVDGTCIVLDATSLTETGNERTKDSETDWGKRLLAMLAPLSSARSMPTATTSKNDVPIKDILRAMEMARASTQRREIPVDDGSWDRLFRAYHVSVDFIKERLGEWRATEFSSIRDGEWNQKRSGFLEPLLGFRVPKKDSTWRLKALPCPEDLSLQQYLLNELLKDYGEEAPSFSSMIPAVRSEFGRPTYTTGPKAQIPLDQFGNPTVLSFAYQIEMDVVNGDSKTIKDGMFRPYVDCWRGFTGFIEDSVRKAISTKDRPTSDSIFVSRLDIKKFYDSVARSTVQNALLHPLTRALEANPAAWDSVASAVRKIDETNPESRARQLIDMLCDMSFGYLHYSPSSGKPVGTNSPSFGLPQGPDLSSYLANIALFKFDSTINELVKKTPNAFCYARYVDDMIVVADTRQAMNQISNGISFELQKLNLELSPKSKALEPMSYRGMQAWLRDERGLQEVSTLVETAPDSGDGLLVDDHGVDRRVALIRLRDATKYELGSVETIKRDVRQVFKCKNLRYNDICRAVAAIWFVVASDSQVELSVDPTERFEQVLRGTLEREIGTSDCLVHLQYAHAGLAKFLRSRSFLRPDLQHASQSKQLEVRNSLASKIDLKFMVELSNLQFTDWLPDGNRFGVAIQSINILNLAARIVPRSQKTPLVELMSWLEDRLGIEDIGSNHAFIRALDSLAGAEDNPELMLPLRQQSVAPNLLFHEMVTRFGNADFLPTIDSSLESALSSETFPRLNKSLRHWFGVTEDAGVLAAEALASLVNCAGANSGKFLNQRPGLVQQALAHWFSVDRLKVLPIFPLTGPQSILACVDGSAQNIKRVTVKESNDEASIIPALEWAPVNSSSGGLGGELEFFEANYLDSKMLSDLSGEFLTNARTPGWIASFFTDLNKAIGRELSAKPGMTIPISALNVFGTAPTEEYEASKTTVIGVAVEKEKIEGQAFVRDGNSAITPRAVPKLYDDIWRVGLTISDLLRLDSKSLDPTAFSLATPSHFNLDKRSWANETIVAYSCYQLRGDGFFNAYADSGEAIPESVSRALARLRRYSKIDEGNEDERTLFALSALCEGRVINRLKSQVENNGFHEVPGLASMVLCQLSIAPWGVDARLAQLLPASKQKNSEVALPRPVDAWLRLAGRLTTLAQKVVGHEDIVFETVVAGIRLYSLYWQIRIFALTLIQDTDIDFLDALTIKESETIVDDWRLPRHTCLIQPRGHSNQNNDVFEHIRIAMDERRGNTSFLNDITLVGWLAVIAAIVEVPDSSLFEAKSTKNSFPEGFLDEVADLARRLAITGENGSSIEDYPWSHLTSLVNAWNPDSISQAIELMNLGQLNGGTELRQSKDFVIQSVAGENHTELVDLNLHGSNYRVRAWQVTRSAISPSSKYEYTMKGQEKIRHWTQTSSDGVLTGIHVVGEHLAKLAGFDETTDGAVPLATEDQSNDPPVIRPTTGEATGDDAETPPRILPTNAEAIECTGKTDEVVETSSPSEADEDSVNAVYEKIKRDQEFSWESRSNRSGNHFRIGFVQWQVKDTYRHPCFEIEYLREKPWYHCQGFSASSREEARRQAILTEVLRACHKFKVEALLLPEYSVRPETVEWLAKEVKRRNIPTTIWAGTFRKPDYCQKNEPSWLAGTSRRWSAVLPVVPGCNEKRVKGILARMKKFPSVALGEVFNPTDTPTAPLWDSQGDIESSPSASQKDLILEVICSEAFLFSSPANLLALAHAQQELRKKFGNVIPSDELISDILTDVRKFSEHTSLTRAGQRRTILFVPAMTTRAVDYLVMAQANYLAAGLTTIFCNSASDCGIGNSCVIGHDGWDNEKATDLPNHKYPHGGPYHGVTPGIYHQWSTEDRGTLGKDEQALVIVDIDPIYSMEGRPRPQLLPKPINLVAHLPILEKTLKPEMGFNKETFSKLCRDWPQQRSGQSFDVNKLLQTLSKVDNRNSYWLKKRAKYFERFCSYNPQPHLSPVVVDWLYVDSSKESMVEIYIPPYVSMDDSVFQSNR